MCLCYLFSAKTAWQLVNRNADFFSENESICLTNRIANWNALAFTRLGEDLKSPPGVCQFLQRFLASCEFLCRDPNSPDLPVWPEYTAKSRRHLEFGGPYNFTVGQALRSDYCDVWRSINRQLQLSTSRARLTWLLITANVISTYCTAQRRTSVRLRISKISTFQLITHLHVSEHQLSGRKLQKTSKTEFTS